ncbi:MAG: Uma2 family endonuclease [Candidatus Binatia bacterium]
MKTTFVSTDRFNQRAFKRWVETRPATDINHYELTNGRIVMTPPAGWGHGEIEARMSRILFDFVESNKLGKVFGSSTGYNLPSGDTLEPDVSFIATARWLKGPQVGRGQFLKIVPNLVVEILSPATAQRDRIEKKKIYETNGVDELWLVDATKREVMAHRLIDSKYGPGKRFTARDVLQSPALPGFRKSTRSLFV